MARGFHTNQKILKGMGAIFMVSLTDHIDNRSVVRNNDGETTTMFIWVYHALSVEFSSFNVIWPYVMKQIEENTETGIDVCEVSTDEVDRWEDALQEKVPNSRSGDASNQDAAKEAHARYTTVSKSTNNSVSGKQ